VRLSQLAFYRDLLTFSVGILQAGDQRVSIAKHGRVFDEDGIGIIFIAGNLRRIKSCAFQGGDVLAMLLMGKIAVDRASPTRVVTNVGLRYFANESTTGRMHGDDDLRDGMRLPIVGHSLLGLFDDFQNCLSVVGRQMSKLF
jgi:hypothetical protein